MHYRKAFHSSTAHVSRLSHTKNGCVSREQYYQLTKQSTHKKQNKTTSSKKIWCNALWSGLPIPFLEGNAPAKQWERKPCLCCIMSGWLKLAWGAEPGKRSSAPARSGWGQGPVTWTQSLKYKSWKTTTTTTPLPLSPQCVCACLSWQCTAQ